MGARPRRVELERAANRGGGGLAVRPGAVPSAWVAARPVPGSGVSSRPEGDQRRNVWERAEDASGDRGDPRRTPRRQAGRSTAEEDGRADETHATHGYEVSRMQVRKVLSSTIRRYRGFVPPGVSLWELLILLAVLLLVFGPGRLPAMGRSLGRGMREFKDAISGVERGTPTPDDSPPHAPGSSSTRLAGALRDSERET